MKCAFSDILKLIYLVKIKDNNGLIEFVVLRERTFRYFPFSMDNFLALYGFMWFKFQCFGTTMESGDFEVVVKSVIGVNFAC